MRKAIAIRTKKVAFWAINVILTVSYGIFGRNFQIESRKRMRDFFFEQVCSFLLFQKYIDENDALPEKAQEKGSGSHRS